MGPCLIWTGKPPKDGYPRMNNREFGVKAPQLVHRVSYALTHGIPWSDMPNIPVIDHLCRVPMCSSAAHLEPVTHAENLRRGDINQNAGKTACDNGHPFDDENTHVQPDGGRHCRTCKRDASREAYRRKYRPDLVGAPVPEGRGRPRGKVAGSG